MKTLADISEPVDIQRKLLEKDVQKQCVEWARSRDYWARKFSSISQRSVPDYLFSRFCAELPKTHFWVEFKAPGKTSTDTQLYEQELMRMAGWRGFECDNFETFKVTVLRYEKEAT